LPHFKSGIVVAANPLATKAGLNALRKGGNAVDAAVSAALTLGVASPAFCGIGGGGFALIWLAAQDKSFFVDYRERAPHAAREDMFRLTSSGKVIRNENSQGHKAIATPGTIAGHSFMLKKYGRLTLKQALAPAIGHARRGFRVGRGLAYAWKMSASKLTRFRDAGRIYLKRGKPYRTGDHIVLRDLAKSYVSISRAGPEEFYTGKLSSLILDELSSNGGLLTRQDMEHFEPTVRMPVVGTYKGLEVISAPPPSSGGAVILEVLNMLEGYDLGGLGHNSPQALHLISETLARGYLNGRSRICDPDFSNIPVRDLISKEFAKTLSSTISPNAATMKLERSNSSTKPTSSTSHLVVVDAEHNVVSMTESVECYFGSGVVAQGTGIVLNDTMHDFDPTPGKMNSVAPWKIPMSSMSPTIIMKEGLPFMAVGSTGATRIISSTLQTILNVVEFGMPLGDAVTAPRIHVQDDQLLVEDGIPHGSLVGLRRMGHPLQIKRPASPEDPGLYFGGVHAALLKPDGLEGAPDPRRDGLAIGLA
jgi:gamma-glutamyltranspeptidase/glutathione hydrolase